jgi:hypothetical protein
MPYIFKSQGLNLYVVILKNKTKKQNFIKPSGVPSVADPGCFIPDPGSEYLFIPDPGSRIPDPSPM